ncbi:MAG: GNAT family N-acetyltransferase [Acidimicrobiia bacterium]|nr:GNAT family N-acetyltransferase [Acidimicrobiia bacterium]
MSELRLLRSADLPDLQELSRAAGWNQTADDWQRLLALAPEGCLGVEEGGRIVSSTTAIRYGRELAWIGMVLTLPEYRKRGFARSLMSHTIDLLRYRGTSWIKLDATEEGRPIYTELGFTAETPIERWRRAPAPFDGESPNGIYPFIHDPVLDRRGFGANRAALLQDLASIESASLPTSAYAMGRPGANACYFGPCVARSFESARLVLEWFLSRHPEEEVFWDLFPNNKPAVELARRYGFEPVRHLTRMGMALSPTAPYFMANDSAVYAVAGFELG